MGLPHFYNKQSYYYSSNVVFSYYEMLLELGINYLLQYIHISYDKNEISVECYLNPHDEYMKNFEKYIVDIYNSQKFSMILTKYNDNGDVNYYVGFVDCEICKHEFKTEKLLLFKYIDKIKYKPQNKNTWERFKKNIKIMALPRYIYYELFHLKSDDDVKIEEKIQNVNVLLFKPEKLNSNGIWGYTNMTKRNHSVVEYVFVHQYWIDTKIFKPYNYMKKETYEKVIEIIKKKLRVEKIKRILQ